MPAFAFAQYWVLSLARGESLSVAAVYRHGDLNYFPMLSGLADLNFGESLVLEHLGEGLRSFPFPSFVLHGFSLGLFGGAGFVLADLLVVVCVFWAARSLFQASGLSLTTSEAFALVLSCGLLGWRGLHLQEWAEWLPRMHVWGFRFPRPFLTDLFLLLCVGSWLRIFAHRSTRPREWVLLGVWFGLLLQVRYYTAATMALAIVLGAAVLLVSSGRRRTIRGLGLSALVTTVIALPFGAQRLLENPDVPRRLGVFPVERLHPMLLERSMDHVIVATAFAAVVCVLVLLRSGPQRSVCAGAVLGLALLCLLSGLALPASTIVLGKTIQPYHFRDELLTFKTLVLVVGFGQICDTAVLTLRGCVPDLGRLTRWSRAAVLCTVAMCCFFATIGLHRPQTLLKRHARGGFAEYQVPGYREAFRELTQELVSEKHSDARVLATLDIQVLDWWSLFGGKYAYCPDACSTDISDDEIEERLLLFLRLIGANSHDVGLFLERRSVLIYYLGCAKYQVFREYHLRPIVDYPGVPRTAFERSAVVDSWRIELPASEQKRLQERYLKTRLGGDNFQLDLIVLGPEPYEHQFSPPADRFRLSFDNRVFRVYEKIRDTQTESEG